MFYIRINKLLKRPLYLQLAESIEHAFENKILENGELLPTEKEICESFNVSTSVVKYAYNHLLEKGIIKREMGRGTFINNELSVAVESSDAFELFLDYTQFKRQIIYIEEWFNKTDAQYPPGPLRIVYEVIMQRKKPVGLRKLYVHQAHRDRFLEEGWDTSQRMHLKMHQFSTVQSHMRVINLNAKEASIIGLDANAPSFFQRVDFYHENALIGTLENYYPGQFFTWRQTVEAIQLR